MSYDRTPGFVYQGGAAMFKALVFIAALLVSAPAAAVSCGAQQSVKQAYSAAQHVFSARVEEIYEAPGFGRDDFRFAKLRILKVWKGGLSLGDIVSVTAEDSVSFVSDGFVPRQGSDVLVYTRGTQPFVLGACSRSAVLDSTRDLPALQKLSRRAGSR
jgi:hypothetical protein